MTDYNDYLHKFSPGCRSIIEEAFSTVRREKTWLSAGHLVASLSVNQPDGFAVVAAAHNLDVSEVLHRALMEVQNVGVPDKPGLHVEKSAVTFLKVAQNYSAACGRVKIGVMDLLVALDLYLKPAVEQLPADKTPFIFHRLTLL